MGNLRSPKLIRRGVRELADTFPDDPELDYHALDDLCRAMSLFPKLQDMSLEDEARVRRALLDYCCLDTLAMVKVLEKLQEAV